jgi:membrane-associated phospholipid phosphatase
MRLRITPLIRLQILSLPLVIGLGLGQDAEPKKKILHQLWDDQKTIWTSLAKKKTWESTTTQLLVSSSAASFALDGTPSRALREAGGLEGFNRVMDSTAVNVALAAYPVAMMVVSAKFGNEFCLDSYGTKSARAAVNSFLTVTVLKMATQRARPHTGKIYGFWEGGNSYPSGHSAVAWTLAAVTARHFSNHKWVPWVVYPLAGLVSFSRVSSGQHFSSDAVTGSVIGFAIGSFAVN